VEILDAQIHPNLVVLKDPPATAAELVDGLVIAMDAVGVAGALLDEWAGYDADGQPVPSHQLAGGICRIDYPVTSLAVREHPRRFISTIRIDPEDPDLSELMAGARAQSRLALRWFPTPRTGPVLGRGDELDTALLSRYARYFEEAQRNRLPVFLVVPDQALLLEPLVRKYPETWFVIDHLGASAPLAGHAGPDRFDYVRKLTTLARYPNVAVKWCHAPRWSIEDFPYRDVLTEFRRLLDAFGPERLMWAGDYTQALRPRRPFRTFSWGEALYYLLSGEVMTADERSWVLGRTLTSIVGWSRHNDDGSTGSDPQST
jgi:L-fuconolactonase